MGEQQRVVLYGNSLMLAGVGASLKGYSGIEVICLAVQPPAAAQELREQPDLLVIGMDAADDKLLILSGQQAHSLTTDDLIHAIEDHTHLPGKDLSL